MKKITVFIVSALLFQTISFSQAQFKLENENLLKDPIKIDTFLSSTILGMDKGIELYLPPGYYDGSDSYPVFYFLHGMGYDHSDYQMLYSIIDTMILNETIDPVILVKPNGDSDPFDGSCFVNSILYGNYEDYMIQEVIPFVDNNFRTFQNREFRAIMGHSMGSTGCIYLGFRHMDTFIGVAGHAGSLALDTGVVLWRPYLLSEQGGSPPYTYDFGDGVFTDFIMTYAGAYSPNLDIGPWSVEFPFDNDGNIVDTVMEKWHDFDVSYKVSNYQPQDSLAIFLSCASNDPLVYPMNLVFVDSLDANSIDYTFMTVNTGHDYTTHVFRSSLIFLDTIMGTPVGIQEEIIKNKFMSLNIYPNPSRNNVFIEYHLAEASNVTISIYNNFGRLEDQIYLKQHDGMNETIRNIERLPAGIYYIQLRTDYGSLTKKMIKI